METVSAMASAAASGMELGVLLDVASGTVCGGVGSGPSGLVCGDGVCGGAGGYGDGSN